MTIRTSSKHFHNGTTCRDLQTKPGEEHADEGCESELILWNSSEAMENALNLITYAKTTTNRQSQPGQLPVYNITDIQNYRRSASLIMSSFFHRISCKF